MGVVGEKVRDSLPRAREEIKFSRPRLLLRLLPHESGTFQDSITTG